MALQDQDKGKILKRDNFRCVYCGNSMISDHEAYLSFTVDHLIPYSKADPAIRSLLANKVTSCRNCNGLKDDYVEPGQPLNQLPKDRDAYIQCIRVKLSSLRSVLLAEFHEALKL